ncbi:FMN-binding protein MioC [Ferrimonas senticii]|uniref:FMN-binding protein MioC n=1 Tax=Ferrimonas senticii TaxID=394566 RepID=UPI0003FB4F8A|nr:FMN-binding protein MioC [Ferrimonas senticii]
MTTPLLLIVGTTMGNAEAVADELEPALTARGFSVTISQDPQVDELQHAQKWLIVCSTHGAGEVPDNLQPWLNWIEQQADLSDRQYALCGIGDRSYDTFCGAIKQLESLLQSRGATAFVDNIEIDVQHLDLPEDQALSWIESWPKRIL